MFSPNDMGIMLFALAGSAGAFVGFLLGYLIRDYTADKALRELEGRIIQLAASRDVSR